MGELTVYFIGICTHIARAAAGIPHRVVLIHEDRDSVINGFPIRKHEPQTVMIGEKISATLPPARRMTYRIANAVGPQTICYDSHYLCAIFGLQQQAGAPVELNDEVVSGGAPPAGVYFDVDRGLFSAGALPHGASAAILTVQTDGNPVLAATAMDGGARLEIEIESGAKLLVRNESSVPQDHDDADFLLHYRVARAIPAGSRFPTTRMNCPDLPALPLPPVDLGPGCSNSRYP